MRAASTTSWRRKSRFLLIVGSVFVAVVFAALLLLGRGSEAYVPGEEAERSDEITRSLRRDLPAEVPRIAFVDAAQAAGIRFRHFQGVRSTQLPEDMGSGAAWGDYDGDSDPDLLLVNETGPLTAGEQEAASSGARTQLFRNDGGGRFTDVTDRAGIAVPGLGMGAAWGDYDGDGDLDLAVTRYGTNLLFRNQGDGTFREVAGETGLAGPPGFWTGVSWSDYDRDGDLDLYICGYVRYAGEAEGGAHVTRQYDTEVPYTLNPSSYPPERNLLYRNEGGVFREVGKASGVDNPTGRSLSASWADFDADGLPDLYVANDISDNALFHNLGNGRFEDISHPAWVADYRGAMGLAVGDWDNDQDLDLFITHWLAQENALYVNQRGVIAATAGEPLHFVDDADQMGLGQISLDFIGWGTDFLDYDNDGRLDLFAANGSTFQSESDPSHLVPMKNQLFWNGGGSRGFFEVGAASGPAFGVENVGRGAAIADFDGDGDQDIAVVVHGGDVRLLRNEGGNRQSWLRLLLRGPQGRRGAVRGLATSTFANGARVRLTASGRTQLRELGGSSSYLSQSPPGEVWFGLGSAERIDNLEIRWPDGKTQSFHDVPARSVLLVREGGEIAPLAVLTVSSEAPDTPPARPAENGKTADSQKVLRFWSLYRDATGMRTKRDFASAASLYRQALELDPHHEDCLYYLGQSLLETGDFNAANAAWEKLVEVNPQSARGHLALGALLASPDPRAPRDLARAEEHLSRAHGINAEETGPMLRLGEVLIMQGRLEEANRWLLSATRTNPKCVDAPFLAGYLAWRSGDRTRAASYFRKAADAARTEAPPKGVLSEGDRKGTGRQPAPPLADPMGKTLLGSFSTQVKHGPAAEDKAIDLDAAYRPLDLYVRAARP
ncbi:MAG TPA: FG-GAP-like repeat-containing protein [Candidatus Polarisedimenticolia bacterium]|nr:FG-GAP-like repeat-containing protein [Candidatus Polarisedimenticolia bacterium]